MQQLGCFWHVHHEILLEWCRDYDGRAEHIRTEKPSKEQEPRLRLFQPVEGQLPQEVVEALKAYSEVEKTYDETFNATLKTEKALFLQKNDETEKAHLETQKLHDEAAEALLEARKPRREALSRHKDAIEALHVEECPDCPWDGETILSAA